MTGGTIKTISLSAFADADGNPEADRMVRIGRWLYVSLERLVNFAPTETSLVAVIDTQAAMSSRSTSTSIGQASSTPASRR